MTLWACSHSTCAVNTRLILDNTSSYDSVTNWDWSSSRVVLPALSLFSRTFSRMLFGRASAADPGCWAKALKGSFSSSHFSTKNLFCWADWWTLLHNLLSTRSRNTTIGTRMDQFVTFSYTCLASPSNVRGRSFLWVLRVTKKIVLQPKPRPLTREEWRIFYARPPYSFHTFLLILKFLVIWVVLGFILFWLCNSWHSMFSLNTMTIIKSNDIYIVDKFVSLFAVHPTTQ